MTHNGLPQERPPSTAASEVGVEVSVIGDAPPTPVWPIYVWSTLWGLWLLFLLMMVLQR